MPTHMLLSVDLPNHVTTSHREKFNAKLQELHWIKLHHLDTVWRSSYGTSTPSAASAIAETKTDVKTAATHAGITEYHAVVHVGPDQPTEF